MRRLLALPAVLARRARVGGARLRARRLRRLRARARAAAGGLAAARRARVHRAAQRAARARDAAAGGRRRRRCRGHRAARGRSGSSSTPARALATGAYRVDWHTVSTEDGHALEGAFSFGVRADAGAAPALETGPLARGGVVRILARIALYATILDARRGAAAAAADRPPARLAGARTWTPATRAAGWTSTAVRARERRLRGDLAWAAVAAAVVATVADAADAARGLDLGRMGDYLAGNLAGAGRALVVVALVAAALLRDRRAARRGGRGRARARRRSPPRGTPARPTRACRASSTTGCTWSRARCGSAGSALLVLLWWPVVRFTRRGSRVAIAREVLAPFGRDRDRRVPRRGLDRARLARHPARPRRRAVGHGLRAAAGGQDRASSG